MSNIFSNDGDQRKVVDMVKKDWWAIAALSLGMFAIGFALAAIASNFAWSAYDGATKSHHKGVPRGISAFNYLNARGLSKFIRTYRSGFCANNERLRIEDIYTHKKYLVCLEQVKQK